MIDLSIVVVTWNTRDLVVECLASIERASANRPEGARRLEIETLVVDNGSRDGTVDAIRACFPWAKVTALPRNMGFSAGCNIAMKAMHGRYVLLLNSDAQLHIGVLEGCVEFLDAHPDVAIVGPQLFNPNGSKQNSIHNYPRVLTELLPVGIFQFLFRRRFPSRRWAGRAPIDVEAVVGAALFARTRAMLRIGPLSEDYFFFLEETDWCWRTRKAGWRVVHLPHVGVDHVSGASSKRKNRALTRIEYHRSIYRFFRTYRGVTSASVVFAFRFIKAFFYVLTRAPLALFGGSYWANWIDYRDVLVWHLRGCPGAVGLGQFIEFGRADDPARTVAQPGSGLGAGSNLPASPLFQRHSSRGSDARA